MGDSVEMNEKEKTPEELRKENLSAPEGMEPAREEARAAEKTGRQAQDAAETDKPWPEPEQEEEETELQKDSEDAAGAPEAFSVFDVQSEESMTGEADGGLSGAGEQDKKPVRKRGRRKKAEENWFRPTDALWAAFWVPVIVMIIIFVQRGIFPFGEQSFLRTDMYHQYAPFFSEFQYKLTHGGSLLYSWDVGMGVNFSALYAYYLASPLNWLLILCPKAYIIEFMSYSIVLKIGLSGLAFTYYLQKHTGRGEFGTAFFGIFYALSGYMAAYSWNIMWLDCILLFPLVMLGLERLVRDKKGLLYCVSLGFCILSNYYISIMICVFMVIYFGCLLILEHHRGKRIGDYVWNCVQFGGCSLAAGGMAAAVLLPEIFALQSTASGNFSFPKTVSSYFSIFDMIARHIGNVDVEIGLNHWPNIYCGVAVLMFFLLYLGCEKITVRHKAVYCGLFLMFFASFSVNVLNFIWHGFHYPNSLPCRQSFIYIFLMLYVCYEAYAHLRETELKHVGWAFLGASAFVVLAEKLVEQEHFEFYMYYVALIFLALYAGLIYLYKKKLADTGMVLILALAVVAVESAVNTTVTSVTTTSRTAYTRDNADVIKLVGEIPEDSGFYRIEKVTRKTKNDGAWMNFPTVSLFSSTASADLTDFFKSVGCEGSVNAYSITGSTPLVDSLLSVRYGLYSGEETESEMLRLVASSGDTYLYERNYTLPLGYMVAPDFDADWQRGVSNPATVQNNLCQVIGAERVLVEAGGTNSTGSFSFTPAVSGNYYVYVSNRQVEKVSVSKGKEALSFDNVNRGYLLDLGWCEADTTVTVNDGGDGRTMNVTAYRFSDEALQSVYEILNRYPLEVEEWTDTRITGTVDAGKDGILFTSIPYDKGWTVKVDGEEQETEMLCGAFLGVPVEAGRHQLEFTYMPRGLKPGIGISLASVLAVLAAAWLGRKKIRFDGPQKKEKTLEDVMREELV